MNKLQFSSIWESDHLMTSNGFSVGFNMPKAIVSKKSGESEDSNSLPPYARRKCFLVDDYLACPTDWMRSSGKLTSYFVAIKEDYGLWLDFNKNQNKKYHVAIVISIQGVNPITGMPCTDAYLEQYIDNCPKHNEKFGANRYCEKCGYNWPKQNYISTTGNNVDELWLDGFRTAEGIVRQYILTKEDTKSSKRGVASNIIGDDKVYAIGLSFFISKEQRRKSNIINNSDIVYKTSATYLDSTNAYDLMYIGTPPTLNNVYDYSTKSCQAPATPAAAAAAGMDDDFVTKSYTRSRCLSLDMKKGALNRCKLEKYDGKLSESKTEVSSNFLDIDDEISFLDNRYREITVENPIKVSKLEVSAGANIKQSVGDDPEPLDFWRKEPEAMITINYCSEEECGNIISLGRIKKTIHKDGFLKGIPVGN
jgi:hypothetical protein